MPQPALPLGSRLHTLEAQHAQCKSDPSWLPGTDNLTPPHCLRLPYPCLLLQFAALERKLNALEAQHAQREAHWRALVEECNHKMAAQGEQLRSKWVWHVLCLAPKRALVLQPVSADHCMRVCPSDPS